MNRFPEKGISFVDYISEELQEFAQEIFRGSNGSTVNWGKEIPPIIVFNEVKLF